MASALKAARAAVIGVVQGMPGLASRRCANTFSSPMTMAPEVQP